jgi:predicted DNA-binding transcriptional regulator YafY
MGWAVGEGKPSGRRADSQQLARQWAILRLLSGNRRGLSVKELAEQLVASKSTIGRDLVTLERQFALVEEQVNKQKRLYRLDESVRALDSICFGTSELLALHAARGALESFAGTPLHDDLREVTSKIRGFLSDRHNGGLDEIWRVFAPHARGYVDYRDRYEVVDDLTDAIARRRVCRAVYHAAWKGTTREHLIKPLRLLWHRSALYLLAQIVDRDEVTTFAVHRIEELALTGDAFTQPRVDLADHARRAFGIFVSDAEEEVEILFDQEIAWRVEERVYHPAEDKERLPDGRLRYRIRSSAQWEILPWVQSFGPLAELVAPASWRDALAENLRSTAALYPRENED